MCASAHPSDEDFMPIVTESEHAFETLRRIVASTVGYPATFAVPVDAHDEPEFLTVVFDARGKDGGTIEVVAEELALILRGGAGTRVCRLPCAIDTASVSTSRRDDTLVVRLRKKGEALDLPRDGLPGRPVTELDGVAPG
jgi:HSP20 family molecular chaperone IbpA